MPVLTLLAGPNGAGKSSCPMAVHFDGRERLLDPDAIARELNPAEPAAAAIAAGRETLRRAARQPRPLDRADPHAHAARWPRGSGERRAAPLLAQHRKLRRGAAPGRLRRVYDNSGNGHRLILAARCGTVTWQSSELPLWAKRLSDSLR